MRRAPTKGPYIVRTRRADGSIKIYAYAWRGGPPLYAPQGTREFDAEFAAAIKARRERQAAGTLGGLAAAWLASPEFEGHADSTRAEWRRFTDLIRATAGPLAIGSLPIEVLGDRRVRQHFLAWRDQWRATPRKADYSVQVLSALLSWAVSRGLIPGNVLLGHATLYEGNRADQIWSADEVDRFVAAAPSPEVGFIVRLACLTGLRRDDLLRMEWSDVGEVAIVLTPNKSRRRRRPKRVTIPLLDDALSLLEEIRAQQDRRWNALAERARQKGRPQPPRPATVLSNTRARRWTKDGAEHQVIDTKHKAGIDKHLHDARGSFATRLRMDGATTSEIADILGWEEARVERLLALYVDTDAVVRSFAERIRARAAARKS